MGWTQRRIRSWVLEEFAVGAGLLAVAGIVLSLVSWNIATVIVSASVLVLYAAAAYFAAQQLRHRDEVDQEPQHDERLIAVDSPLTFANRQLSTNKFNTISLAVAVGVFGAAVGGLIALLIDIPAGRRRERPERTCRGQRGAAQHRPGPRPEWPWDSC